MFVRSAWRSLNENNVNLEPTEEYPSGTIVFGSREKLRQVFDIMDDFLTKTQAGQDENGDPK